jgi:transcriptional regulator with XRE-family HTH domain
VVNGPTLKDLGLDVRRARKERRWTQETLAKEAAVALTLVGKIERGQPVSDTTLRAVARTLTIDEAAIEPHLTDRPVATAPARVDPATATWGDLRRELAWWHARLRDTPEDYQRLLALLELSAALEDSPNSTQSSTQFDAHG